MVVPKTPVDIRDLWMRRSFKAKKDLARRREEWQTELQAGAIWHASGNLHKLHRYFCPLIMLFEALLQWGVEKQFSGGLWNGYT